MKKLLGLSAGVLFIIVCLSCRQSQKNQTQTHSDAKLQVFYFHTAIRCPSCTAIENNTKKVLDKNYKTLLDSGIIKFYSYNIDDKENRSIIEKYEISYLTLLIVNAEGLKTDFTNTALLYAETKPEKFIELLKAEIDKNLK
jgi:hypothetical protein